MLAPKSILRSTSFKVHNQPKSFDDSSTFGSLGMFIPPFMRGVGKKVAPELAETKPEEHVDGRVEEVVEARGGASAQEDERTLEPKDDRINMSVTFDDKIDDISMVMTFDYDQKVASPPPPPVDEVNEHSVEVTFDNYLEFEAMRKKKADKGDEDGSEQAMCVEMLQGDQLMDDECKHGEPSNSKKMTQLQETDKVEEVRVLKERNELEEKMQILLKLKNEVDDEKELEAKIEKQHKVKEQKKRARSELENQLRKLEEEKAKAKQKEFKKEIDELRTLKKRVEEEKAKAKLKNVRKELKAIKASIEKSKISRVPVEETVQKRLQTSVGIITEALATQEKLDAEVAEIKARAALEKKDIKPAKPDESEKILFGPPPIREKMKCNNYDSYFRQDSSATEYDNWQILDPKATESDLDSDMPNNGVKMLSRPGHIKPAPKISGMKMTWYEVTELAEDLQYALNDDDASEDGDENLEDEEVETRLPKHGYTLPKFIRTEMEKLLGEAGELADDLKWTCGDDVPIASAESTEDEGALSFLKKIISTRHKMPKKQEAEARG